MHFADLERIAHFRKRLSETVAWCDTKEWAAHPGQGLCTPLLRPPEMRDNMQAIIDSLRLLQKNGEQLTVEQAAINRQWQENVKQLATKRASFLQVRAFAFSQPVQFQLGGRLLAFDPQNSLDDGLAGEVTQGFFDDCNIPAWDTWISYVIEDEAPCPFNAYLLSWVPEALVESVEAGIHVNMEECICWASDLETVFVRQIRQAGLIR
jgi:hypothetical protein